MGCRTSLLLRRGVGLAYQSGLRRSESKRRLPHGLDCLHALFVQCQWIHMHMCNSHTGPEIVGYNA